MNLRPSKTIGAVLEKHGMDVTYEFCNLPTAFKASPVKVDNPKGRLAILCEYDALPEVGACMRSLCERLPECTRSINATQNATRRRCFQYGH